MPDSLEPHKDVLDVLANAGLVAPLRLIKGDANPDQATAIAQ
jgi:hypothetical protein